MASNLTFIEKGAIACDAIKREVSDPPAMSRAIISIVAEISLLALSILGGFAIAGQIPGITLGCTAAGLGGIMLFDSFLQRNESKMPKLAKHTVALNAATVVTLGILGAMGILSAPQLGMGLVTLLAVQDLTILWQLRLSYAKERYDQEIKGRGSTAVDT